MSEPVTEVAAEDGEEDEETSPAEDFALKLGVPLALTAVAWAFVGPAHLLEVGRYELPVVASFVEPFPMTFLAYVAGLTFVFAFAGSLAVPSVVDEYDDYAADFAISLVMPAAGLAVLLAILGLVFPALYLAVTGELVRAGLVLGMAVVLVVVGLLFQIVAILAIGAGSAPLWLPAFVGSYAGSILRTGLPTGSN